MGVRVNETNRLIATAKATVSPKLEKKRPTIPHEHEGRDDRRGDGQGGDQGRPPVADEQEDRGRDQHAGLEQMKLHFLDRFLDEPRLVADDLGRDVRRQRGLELAEPVRDVLDDLDRVDSRLFLHHQADCAVAIEPGQRAGLFAGIARAADVTHADGITVTVGDDQVIEFALGPQPAQGSQNELARALVNATSGDLEVLPDQGLADVVHRRWERGPPPARCTRPAPAPRESPPAPR